MHRDRPRQTGRNRPAARTGKPDQHTFIGSADVQPVKIMAWVAGYSRRWIVVGALLALMGAAAPAVAETRVALVIGNGAYKHLTRLPNPAGDAELMAATL